MEGKGQGLMVAILHQSIWISRKGSQIKENTIDLVSGWYRSPGVEEAIPYPRHNCMHNFFFIVQCLFAE